MELLMTVTVDIGIKLMITVLVSAVLISAAIWPHTEEKED